MKTMRFAFLLGISTSMALAQVDSRDVDSKDITQELDSQERNLNERESSAKQNLHLKLALRYIINLVLTEGARVQQIAMAMFWGK